MTGVTTHTLRKWESRYGVIEPERTSSGRRLYSPAQVRKLILLRDLIEQGHQISQLSQMSDAELEGLIGEGRSRALPAAFDEITVVGHVITAVLERERLKQVAFNLIGADGTQWLARHDGAPAPAGKMRALVIELATLSQEKAVRLLELRSSYKRLVVVYGFSGSAVVQRLLDAGIVCCKGPVTGADLLQALEVGPEEKSLLDLLHDPAIPARRFSPSSIAALAGLSPAIQCECPNHIAQLLMDISAFEQYSMECEDSDPSERALHARLRLIAAHARALFEEAMENVARAEGLKLEEE